MSLPRPTSEESRVLHTPVQYVWITAGKGCMCLCKYPATTHVGVHIVAGPTSTQYMANLKTTDHAVFAKKNICQV